MRPNVLDTYEAWSPSYDSEEVNQLLYEIEEMVVGSILRSLKVEAALDVATGTARSAVRLRGLAKRVIGAELSRGMLREAALKVSQMSLEIPLLQSDLSVLPFRDGVFDLVTCSLALAHVPHLDRAFGEFARVLRPGGHVVTFDLHPDIQAIWGPDFLLEVAGEPWPFPQYHGVAEDYSNGVQAAGLELLATIDIPMCQGQRGPGATGGFVVFARKGGGSHAG